jgi:phosphoribosylanthranilate isomerase
MTIKICGITRLEDALAAADLGVHALGFVLWTKSPRAIAVGALSPMLAKVPPFVTAVGVFVDPTGEEIVAARDAGIQVAQVHGTVPALPDGLRLLPAVTLGADDGALDPEVAGNGPVLVDAHDPIKRGGTGRTVDWRRARVVARRRPIILAGGLTPANVGTAIREVRPLGVDVSTGVEREAGLKDYDKLAAFVAAVKAQA